VYIV
jgi:hypothetical protein